MEDLSVRLVRPDGECIDHHEGEIPRDRDAGIRGDDCDVWRGSCLLHRKALTWCDGADTGEGDGHSGGGAEGGKKVGDEVGILETGFNGSDVRSRITDGNPGKGVGEESQDRKSKCG